jgi:hypothetical protein
VNRRSRRLGMVATQVLMAGLLLFGLVMFSCAGCMWIGPVMGG